jgi:predicted enzyme related to lactoylglutathione lyase
MKLNSVMIGSEDAPGLATYYTKLFGTPAMEDGGFSGWQLGGGWLSVVPHDQVTGKNQSPGRVIWNLETADVRGEFERLKGAGATVVQEPYAPGDGDQAEMLVATFSDPDNNYFQLVSPM